MATLEYLTDKVIKIIQDDSFTDDDIANYLNEGVQELAGGITSSLGDFITPPLPKLFSIATVSTALDIAFVSMPVTFHRSLIYAANASGNEIEIDNSWFEFIETSPLLDIEGSLYKVIEKGNNLYYQRLPTTIEDITIHFYRLPVAMVGDSDVPDGLPEHLHTSLLVNYVCYKIYELIEDGIEGESVNTQRYEQRFLQALRTLELSIPCETQTYRSSF